MCSSNFNSFSKAACTLSPHDMNRQSLPLPVLQAAKKIYQLYGYHANWVDATHTYMIKIVHRQLII